MEDVLSVYADAPDLAHPVVCFDELPYQLRDHARPPLPRQPGMPQREDYEYVRQGTCNLFGVFEPHVGRRQVTVTAQRTAVDFAEAMRMLVDEGYPEAETVRVVLDNLNTHSAVSLYEAFAPAEARRIARRLAEPNGDRAGGVDETVLGSTHRGGGDPRSGSSGMGASAERGEGDGAMAVRSGAGAREAGAPLPFMVTLADY